MVDTTKSKCGGIAAKSPLAAGAPNIEITPAMIEAGAEIFYERSLRPEIAASSWEEDLAKAVYRAMESARYPKPNQSLKRNRAK